jgi:hypothetical protein
VDHRYLAAASSGLIALDAQLTTKGRNRSQFRARVFVSAATSKLPTDTSLSIVIRQDAMPFSGMLTTIRRGPSAPL